MLGSDGKPKDPDPSIYSAPVSRNAPNLGGTEVRPQMPGDRPPTKTGTPVGGGRKSLPDDMVFEGTSRRGRGETVRETLDRSIQELQDKAVSEGQPPQTADNAVRAFILLFALGFVLRGIDVMDHDMPNAIQKWVIAAGVTLLDYFYVPIRTALGPRFASTAAKVGTDFRWWVVAALVLLSWAAVSPVIEKQGWPSLAQKEPALVIHDPPSADDIAKATALIQSKLDAVTQQRDAALADAASLRHQIAGQSTPPPQPIPNQGPIAWRVDSQLLVISGGGPRAVVNGLIFQGTRVRTH